MGGLKTFITTNTRTQKSTKPLFEAAALAMFKKSGGGDKYAIVSPANYVEIASLFSAAETVQHTESNAREYWWGMSPVGIYTKFGKINLFINRWLVDSFIPIIDLNNIGMKTFAPFFIEPWLRAATTTRNHLGRYALRAWRLKPCSHYYINL